MLSFPTPYPNELFYSVLARYTIRNLNLKSIYDVEDLYGTRSVVPTVDMASNIKRVIERIPKTNGITVESILNENTLAPLLSTFISKEQRHKIYEAIILGNTSAINIQLAMQNSGCEMSRTFNHCKKCIELDLQNYGETFWHREHHINGLFVCVHHEIPLSSTGVLKRGNNRQKFIPAVGEVLNNLIDFDLCENELLHQVILARDIKWLIDRPNYILNSSNLYCVINNAMIKHQYIKANNYTDYQRFQNDFVAFYGKEYLNRINCNVENVTMSWLYYIVKSSNRKHYFLKYLILMRFLGLDISELRENDFIDNIEMIQLEWDKKLIALCEIKESIRSISNTLGASTKTVRKAIDRLKIEPYWNLEQTNSANRTPYILTEKFDQVRAKKRELWLDVLSELEETEPVFSAKQSEKLKSLYGWLKKYDVEWLSDKKITFDHKPSRVDWKQRDEEYYEEVEKIIKNMKTGEPQRITKNTIGLSLGIADWLNKSIKELPKIKVLIEENEETLKHYHIRKIDWAYSELLKEGSLITVEKLIEKSKVKAKYFYSYDLSVIIGDFEHYHKQNL